MRKHSDLVNYRDYIKSEYWTERKRLYYLNHPHTCAVCGHPDVELHHLRYGDYGHEQDKNLAALCRVHHQELHNAVALRKNTFYQSNSVIEDMKTKWEELISAPIRAEPKADPSSSFSDLMESLVRPIWHFLGRK